VAIDPDLRLTSIIRGKFELGIGKRELGNKQIKSKLDIQRARFFRYTESGSTGQCEHIAD